MATLTLDKLNLIYPDGTQAVRDVDLTVEEGEFCVFLGPSGCGKTSTLRMIAGLESVTSGEIRLDGRVINNLYPGERDIAMVFQHYALYPNRTVRDHFEFPLRAQKMGKAERDRRVGEIAELLRMTDLLEAKPRQLSGGQAQRTAIGRALIRNPKLFLLDEPLTSLDATLRLETRSALKRLQSELKITTVYVTHDQEEALSLADRIVIMHDGRVQQFASPAELYREPVNLFVAGFVGTPAMNFVRGTLRRNGATHIETSGFRLPVPEAASELVRAASDAPVVAGVRPEDLVLGPAPADESMPRGQIVVVEPQGDERIVSLALAGGNGQQWKVRAPRPADGTVWRPGDVVGIGVKPRGLRLFDAATEARVL
jgi:multiple sugar transport system ATP-binding protein